MTLAATRKCSSDRTPSDLDFERVQETVADFMCGRAVLTDWREDCYQEAWLCRLENRHINARLKEWLQGEWDNFKHRSFERLRRQAMRNEGDDDSLMDVLALKDQVLREQVGGRAHPAEPYETAVARLDGRCPRHKEFQPVEFGENRGFGLCEKCGFAYDFSSDAEATPQRF